ncbi:MAG TPA: YbhN family protein, partial [Acidimicrobiales bacterium]|nr:YbhN family protein [Acidimicrobiales bacterium]
LSIRSIFTSQLHAHAGSGDGSGGALVTYHPVSTCKHWAMSSVEPVNPADAAAAARMARQSEEAAPTVVSRLRRLVPRPLRHAFFAFLAILVIYVFVIPTLLNARNSLSVLSHINVVWIIVGVLLEAGSLVAYACLTKTVLPLDGDSPSLWTLLRIDMSTLAVTHVLPGGVGTSSGLGYRLLTSRGVAGPDAGVAMGTQGIGSAVVLNLLLWVALVISIPLNGLQKGYVAAALAGVLLFIFIAALIYLITEGVDVAARIIRAVIRPVPRIDGDKVEAVVRRVGARIRDLGSDRKLLRRSFGWAAANWLLDAASLWAFVAAFDRGHFISPVYLFVAYGVGMVLAAIPITPSGLGFTDAAVPAALVGFGLTKNVAYLAVVAWRLVNFWLPIPVGAGCYVSLRFDRDEAERHTAGAALAELRTMPDMAKPVEPGEQEEDEASEGGASP